MFLGSIGMEFLEGDLPVQVVLSGLMNHAHSSAAQNLMQREFVAFSTDQREQLAP